MWFMPTVFDAVGIFLHGCYMVVLCILHDGCSIAGTLFYPFCMFGIDCLDDCCGNVIWLLDNVYGFVVSH